MGTFYLLCAPANSQIGLGHLSRICSFAFLFEDVHIYCETQEQFPIDFLNGFPFSYQTIKRLPSFHTLVTDGSCDFEFLKMHSFQRWIHLGDHLPDGCFADILIDGEPFNKEHPRNVRYLQGHHYHLISPLIYSFKPKEYKKEGGRSCLLNFGGADPGHLSEYCLKYKEQFELTLLVGMGFNSSRIENFKEIKLCYPKNPKEVALEILKHDICFTMGGLGTYESLYLGTPVGVLEWSYMTTYARSLVDIGWVGKAPIAKVKKGWNALHKGNKVLESLNYNVKVAVVVQARMGSERLPGKVMKELSGKPMLVHLLERLKQVNHADIIIVTTSDHEKDNPIEAVSEHCWRGNEDNVWKRFVDSVEYTGAEVVVRITGDCPFINPELIDRAIEAFIKGNYDLVSVSSTRGFPRGLDTEVFSRETLLNQPSNNPYVKEHVTWDIHEIGKNILYLDPGEEYRYPWRLCVDEDLDWKLVETIYKNLYQGEPISWKSLKEFLIENVEVAKINTAVKQRCK